MKPKISVIIPIYNCEKYLDRLINSILNQSYTSFELILINDGSKDNSGKIIKTYQDKRIKILDKENTGVSDSRNKGLEIATGELICFLDSDDYISPNYFETIISYFEKYPKTELLNFGFYSETENDKLERINYDLISYKEKYYENKEEIKKDFVELWDNTMLYNIWLISGHFFILLKIRVLPLIYLTLFIWHFSFTIILYKNLKDVPYE